MWPYRIWRWRIELQEASDNTALDISLLAAIMERESRGGDALTPMGPRGTGDGGHGRGLMQIDDRYHQTFCSDIGQWGDSYQNILYGATILRTGIRSLGSDPKGIAAYNAGVTRVRKSGFEAVPDLDSLTTGRNYVSDVLNKRDWFEANRD